MIMNKVYNTRSVQKALEKKIAESTDSLGTIECDVKPQEVQATQDGPGDSHKEGDRGKLDPKPLHPQTAAMKEEPATPSDNKAPVVTTNGTHNSYVDQDYHSDEEFNPDDMPVEDGDHDFYDGGSDIEQDYASEDYAPSDPEDGESGSYDPDEDKYYYDSDEGFNAGYMPVYDGDYGDFRITSILGPHNEICKTDAMKEFSLSSKNLEALTVVRYQPSKYRDINPAARDAHIYNRAQVKALAIKLHGGTWEAHVEHKARNDRRAAKARETRERNKREVEAGIRLPTPKKPLYNF